MMFFFFFNDTATTEIYTLSLHDALPICQHVFTPLQGVALHINAFNFPVWGMLEKLGPTLLAGVPAIVKPASSTGYLAEHAFRIMIESGILPPGTLQLIMGGVGDLFAHLTIKAVVRSEE